MTGNVSAQMGGYLNRDRNAATSVSQKLAVSDPVISTIILNAGIHAIGNGLTLSLKLDAEALKVSPEVARKLGSQIEKAWLRWSRNALECDLSGRHNVDQIVAAAFESRS